MLSEEISQFSRGKFVHRRKDQYGGILVIDKGDHRVLTFDTIYEQSRLNIEHPAMLAHFYTRAMLLGLAFVEPKHITMLGLGSGCLLQVFHEMFSDASLSVVEYRQAVVEVAQEYFCLPQSPNIDITVTDAQFYLKKSATASTDIIFSDLYNADEMNPLQLQKSFLRECERVLTEEGWLIGNFHQLPDTTSEFFVTLQKYFKEILIYQIPEENYIIYAGKQRLCAELDSYLPRTGWFPYNEQIGYDALFKRMVRLTI